MSYSLNDSQVSWGMGVAYDLTENNSLRLEKNGFHLRRCIR